MIPSLQEEFLAEMTDKQTPCTVFLVNGVKLRGRIAKHDLFTVLLKRDQQKQLVFKHAISTVMPQEEGKP